MRGRRRAGVAALAVTLCATACVGTDETPDPVERPDPTDVVATFDGDIVASVGPDVGPLPTNRWYSGLVLGETPMPVFAEPLSFSPTADGYSWGLPRVTQDSHVILAPASTDVTMTWDGDLGRPVATHADSVHVRLTYSDPEGREVASVDLAQGWPAVAITAREPLTLTSSRTWDEREAGVFATDVDGTTYGLRISGGTVTGDVIALDAGGSLLQFVVPDGASANEVGDALGGPLVAVDVGFDVGDDVTTRLSYRVAGATSTVVALPEERVAGLECLGEVPTVRGALHLCAASEVAWAVPLVAPTTSLDLSAASDAQLAAIREAVAEAVPHLGDAPADTYFGGKWLARTANLVRVADAVGSTEHADALAASLSEELLLWAQPDGCAVRDERCFSYDRTTGGVVGREASFGAEEFNDHHFHYGYFLYAAAVLAERDPESLETLEPVMDLVARDIASPATDRWFPGWRVFDPYRGHSWASGLSPFADGNNQESVSEAVAAWNGVAAWGQASGDDALTETGTWMLAAESDAARRLWIAPHLEAFPVYAHESVAIEWGGKRDFATWFSPEPSAILGIVLLPLSPAQVSAWSPHGPADAELILRQLESASPDGTLAGLPDAPQFADYLIMYRALASDADSEAAWEQAAALPTASIDDGNTRAYMLAWIAAAGSSGGG